MADQNNQNQKKTKHAGPPDFSVDTYDPGGMAGKGVEPREESAADKKKRQDLGKPPTSAVDTYDPGGMAGDGPGDNRSGKAEQKNKNR